MTPPRKTFKFTIPDNFTGLRIDRCLSLKFPDSSRTYFQKLIDLGLVEVNDSKVKPSIILNTGDTIFIEFPPPEKTHLLPENIQLDIRYEDKDLLVVNKPAGLVVHPGAGVKKGTLVNALLFYCKDLSGVGGRLRPGIVHRLDKNTSGLMVVAKNDNSHIKLQSQFAEKISYREYKALVWGNLKEAKGRIETKMNRSKQDRKKFAVSKEGKNAITLFEVEKYYPLFTLVKILLKTGRTHQIRVHFNHINHPVFGDPDYSGRTKQIKRLSNLNERNLALNLLKLLNRQALHAFRLGFEHPTEKKWMEFTVPLPDDYSIVLKTIESFEENI